MMDEEQDPLARLKARRADPLARLKAKKAPVQTFSEGHSKFTPAQLAGRADRQVANAQDEQDVEDTGVREEQLGGLAAFGRHIPFIQDAQEGAMSLVSGKPIEAMHERLQGAEDANPASDLNRMTGGTIAALAGQEAGGKLLSLIRGKGSRVIGALRNASRAARGVPEPVPVPETPFSPKSLADAPKTLIEPPTTRVPTQSPIGSALEPSAPSPLSRVAGRVKPTPEVPQTLERQIPTQSPADAVMERSPLSRAGNPRPALERQFQNVVDEGQSAYDASLHKGTPMGGRPPLSPEVEDLIQRIQQGLRPAEKAARASRTNPSFRPTGGQSSGMSVADVLRSKRP